MSALVSPENLNLRLANQQFLSHPADRRFFDDLLGRIRMMAQSAELQTNLPDVNEAHAWTKAFRIYQALKQFERMRAPTQGSDDAALAALNRSWHEYLDQRQQILELVRRGRINEEIAQYLELQPGDLDSPIEPDSDNAGRFGGRHPNWSNRAVRIDRALCKWQEITPSELASIPQVMELRRMKARFDRLMNEPVQQVHKTAEAHLR